jgi:hypothetical protein
MDGHMTQSEPRECSKMFVGMAERHLLLNVNGVGNRTGTTAASSAPKSAQEWNQCIEENLKMRD